MSAADTLSQVMARVLAAVAEGTVPVVLIAEARAALAAAPAPEPARETRKLCTCDGAGRGPGRACVVKAGGRLGDLWCCADEARNTSAAPAPVVGAAPAAWIRWEYNRTGRKTLVWSRPTESPLREEAIGVVYDPLYAPPPVGAGVPEADEDLYLVHAGGDGYYAEIVPASRLDDAYLRTQWGTLADIDPEQRRDALEHFHDDDQWTHEEPTGRGGRVKFSVSFEDGWVEVVRLPSAAAPQPPAQAEALSITCDESVASALWDNEAVMSLNAELGLSMDQLVRLARALTCCAPAAPAEPTSKPAGLRGFGVTITPGGARNWYAGADGVKRWVSNDQPCDTQPDPPVDPLPHHPV